MLHAATFIRPLAGVTKPGTFETEPSCPLQIVSVVPPDPHLSAELRTPKPSLHPVTWSGTYLSTGETAQWLRCGLLR